MTEYRLHCLHCLSCKRLNRGEWSEPAQNGAFGAKVVAVIGYLTGRLVISHRDAAETMQELFAIKISLGNINAAQKRLSQRLAEPVAVIQEVIEQELVSLVDETTRREKQAKPWLWVKATSKATLFRILPGRSREDAKAIIGRNENGFVTSDRYAAYNHLANAKRQICWAHLKRDFQAFAERDGDSKTIGEGLLEQSKGLFSIWQRVRDGTSDRRDFQKLIEPVKEKVSRLLFEGTLSTNTKISKTRLKILKLEVSLWTFCRAHSH